MQIRHIVLLLIGGVLCTMAPRGLGQNPAQPVSPPPPVAPLVPAVPPQPPQPTPLVAPPPVTLTSVEDLPETIIAWDALDKSVTVNTGEPSSSFSFNFTNLSSGTVTVSGVHTSCGCTTAQLPAMPWEIPAGGSDVLNINMNLAGKSGTVIKSVTVSTDKGYKNLLVRTMILPLETSTDMPSGAREQNQMLSLVDRQAVFKGDCATCHSEPATGKRGAELFAAACGVCHEAEHRASMVPDLKVAKQERNAEYWKNWITNGKQGSLMPAFAVSAGGILTDEQIASLVDHLLKTLPTKPAPAAAGANVPAPAAH